MSSPASKTEKEKQKLIQEKCQTILASMLRDEDNKYCVDCDAKGPRWASWNLGIFLCIRCAGIHRNLGVHISRVKSVNLDSWTPEQVVSLQQMGNSRARAVYEANLPDSFRRPQTDSTLESFIRAKYEAKKYIAKEWVCPPPVKVSWDAEIEMEMKRKKEAKRKANGSPAAPVELPTPSSSRTRPSEAVSTVSSTSSSVKEVSLPAPLESSQSSSQKPSSAAQDLLGLDTLVSNPAGSDLFGGLLATNAEPTNGSATTAAAAALKNSEEDSFFNQKVPSVTEKRTLDKNSILALYNQSGTNNTPAAMPPMQNMFATQGVYAPSQQAFAPNPSMNQAPGMMANNYNSVMQGNMFSSPMFPTNGAMAAPTGGTHMTQLSQQMTGLNFGSTVHNPMSAPATSVPGMMVNNAGPVMNPGMMPANSNPYMFLSSTGMQPVQQQQQQHATTLSTNLWQ